MNYLQGCARCRFCRNWLFCILNLTSFWNFFCMFRELCLRQSANKVGQTSVWISDREIGRPCSSLSPSGEQFQLFATDTSGAARRPDARLADGRTEIALAANRTDSTRVVGVNELCMYVSSENNGTYIMIYRTLGKSSIRPVAARPAGLYPDKYVPSDSKPRR